jgi:glycosyltransferase involved in cell wall biosynthesis
MGMIIYLHINNICGLSQTLCQEQRRLGIWSGVLDLPKEKTFFKRFKRRLKLIKISINIIPRTDILHFHYHTILPFGLDLIVWKVLGKEIIMHFHGSDIRGKGTQFLKLLLADKIFVSTPDLLKWTRGDAVWLPNPINLELPELQPIEKEDSPIITIVHAPSDRHIKGTKYLQLAIQSLQFKGYPVRLKIIENQSHEVALKAMQRADIVVDQLLSGYYSMVTIEAWALGKPVICYIDFSLPYISEVPVCPADPVTIRSAIKELIEFPETRKMWAEKGREYVKRVHDVKGVVHSYGLSRN